MKTLEQISERYGIRILDDGTVTLPDWDTVLSVSENFRLLATKETTSRWHQEKNMLTHTKLVCESMLALINRNSADITSERDKITLMLAAMFHDLGKCRCSNTEDGRLLSAGHPQISERLCRQELWELNVIDRERICELVLWHDLYCSSDISDKKLLTKIGKLSMWLFIHLDYLFMLWMSDDSGAIKPVELEGSSYKMIDRVKSLDLKSVHHIPNGSTKGLSDDFTVYVMCGIPGCGKSTWCADNIPELPVVSRDIVREELGITDVGVKAIGTKEEEDEVTRVVDAEALELCKARQSFVYDNMNSREKYRKAFYDKIRKFKPVVRYIYLEVTDLGLLERRRPEIACKGDGVFDRLVYNMEFPRPYEYDTLEIHQNLSDPSDEYFNYDLIGTLHLN